MKNVKDLLGQKFNDLTVLERVEDSVDNQGKPIAMWRCQCDCGKIVILRHEYIKYGSSKSCGCRHGEKHGDRWTSLYKRWLTMKQRCTNPNVKGYPHWGGRGITICEEWSSFLAFKEWAMNNGYREDLLLDREDNDKGYCPENCRWVDRQTQNSNRRNNVNITIDGETHNVNEWARIKGMHKSVLQYRLKRGWTNEEAVLTPVRKCVRRT